MPSPSSNVTNSSSPLKGQSTEQSTKKGGPSSPEPSRAQSKPGFELGFQPEELLNAIEYLHCAWPLPKSQSSRFAVLGKGGFSYVVDVPLEGKHIARRICLLSMPDLSAVYTRYENQVLWRLRFPSWPGIEDPEQMHRLQRGRPFVDVPSCIVRGKTLEGKEYAITDSPLYEGGTLWQLMKGSSSNANATLKKRIVTELVLALEYLHGLGINHCDLKPENIMLTKTGHVRVIDFGFADLQWQLDPTPRGSEGYRSPEMKRPEDAKTHGPAVDIYALGCIIDELYLECEEYTSDVKDLVTNCKKIVAERWTLPDVMNSPFFEGTNWNDCSEQGGRNMHVLSTVSKSKKIIPNLAMPVGKFLNSIERTAVESPR